MLVNLIVVFLEFIMNNSIYNYITEYFTVYLPLERGVSKNTIMNYKYTILIFIEYLKNEKKSNLIKFHIKKIDKDLIIDFIQYLLIKRNNSYTTTNSRLNALKSFCEYIQIKEIEFTSHYLEIKNIKPKKTSTELTNYLTIDETKNFFKAFNINNRKELRDYTFLSMLYDSGARVSEITQLKLSNINFINNTILLHGKGNKVRVSPISINVIAIIRQYIDAFNISDVDSLLFTNKQGNQITKEGINYIIQGYAKKADINYKKITPHSFRHSKAMHLLENDVNLIYIRDFLGHSSVLTTEKYARANPNAKRVAIEKSSNQFFGTSDYKNDEDTLLNWLNSIK